MKNPFAGQRLVDMTDTELMEHERLMYNLYLNAEAERRNREFRRVAEQNLNMQLNNTALPEVRKT